MNHMDMSTTTTPTMGMATVKNMMRPTRLLNWPVAMTITHSIAYDTIANKMLNRFSTIICSPESSAYAISDDSP